MCPKICGNWVSFVILWYRLPYWRTGTKNLKPKRPKPSLYLLVIKSNGMITYRGTALYISWLHTQISHMICQVSYLILSRAYALIAVLTVQYNNYSKKKNTQPTHGSNNRALVTSELHVTIFSLVDGSVLYSCHNMARPWYKSHITQYIADIQYDVDDPLYPS